MGRRSLVFRWRAGEASAGTRRASSISYSIPTRARPTLTHPTLLTLTPHAHTQRRPAETMPTAQGGRGGRGGTKTNGPASGKETQGAGGGGAGGERTAPAGGGAGGKDNEEDSALDRVLRGDVTVKEARKLLGLPVKGGEPTKNPSTPHLSRLLAHLANPLRGEGEEKEGDDKLLTIEEQVDLLE